MRLTRVERIVTRNACFFFLVMILRGGIIIGGAIRKVSAQTGSGVWTTFYVPSDWKSCGQG